MDIYVISNSVNEKKYIGQTTLDPPLQRWQYHLKSAKRKPRKSDMLIIRAMRKHGVEKFTIEYFPLKGEQTQERLNRAEVRAIKKHNSMHPNGYNIKEGGSNGKHSKISRLRMSQAKTGVPIGPMPQFHRDAIRDGNKGKPKSQAHKDAISKTLTGIPQGPMPQSHRNAIRDGKLRKYPPTEDYYTLRARGLCTRCKKPRGNKISKNFCASCLEIHRFKYPAKKRYKVKNEITT